MLICASCGQRFAQIVQLNDVRLDLRGRKRCLKCRPHRPLRAPRKPVPRAVATKTCAQCGSQFTAKAVIDGRTRSLYRRRFCLTCSPFGLHNTSKLPAAALAPNELLEHRRKRRNAKTYRYQKAKRTSLKAEFIAMWGGRCDECGYDTASAALEFHHRDANTKEFQISYGSVSRIRLMAEVAKCVLLCANCHRMRHISARKDDDSPTVQLRRERKRQAVMVLGGSCRRCGREVPAPLFEFHHLDARMKDFSISADGIARSWTKIEAELAKCILLCANCHRETHVRLRAFARDHAIGEASVETVVRS